MPHPRSTPGCCYTAARAAILSRNWEIDRAEAELASVRETAIALGLMRPYSCVAALLQSIRGRAEAAVEAATRGLTAPGWINDFFELVGVMGMVAGLRELGRVEELQQAVERGYRLSRASPHSPTVRYPLGVLHLDALRLSGLLRAQRQAADTLADEPMDDAFARTHRALFEGMTAMALGDLAAARNWLRETLATGAARETTWIGRSRSAVAGHRHVDVRRPRRCSHDPGGARSVRSTGHSCIEFGSRLQLGPGLRGSHQRSGCHRSSECRQSPSRRSAGAGSALPADRGAIR